LAKRARPVIFHVRPCTKGLDTSLPPQSIDMRASPSMLNVRFDYNQVQTRDGFKIKYFGCQNPIMLIDILYDQAGNSDLMAFTTDKIYQLDTANSMFKPMFISKKGTMVANGTLGQGYITPTVPADKNKLIRGMEIYHVNMVSTDGTYIIGWDSTSNRIYLSADVDADGAAVTVTIGEKVTLTASMSSDYCMADVGEGTFKPNRINMSTRDVGAGSDGVVYPTTGYADIMAFTNAKNGPIVIIPSTDCRDVNSLRGELIEAAGASGCRSVVTYDNRLMILGTSDNPSEVKWSVAETFEDFTSDGSGSAIVGDSPDYIQRGIRMGDLLMVYKERSIFVGRKTGISNPAISFEPAPGQGIGLAAPMSIGDLGEEHIFLGWDDVYIFSITGMEPIGSQIKDDLFGYSGTGNGIRPEYIKRCVGTIVEEYDEYWLFVPTGRVPAITNIMRRGCMDFARISGDINADTNVGNLISRMVRPLCYR